MGDHSPIGATRYAMLQDLFPFRFHIDAATAAAVGLWSLALYLGFSPVSDWVIQQLERWFNFAERSLYTSQEEFEKTKLARESQNAFYASLFSIVPFLITGGLLNYGVELSLGRSWALSVGMIVCLGAGVYELGRRAGQQDER
jgi:hypothetical protein